MIKVFEEDPVRKLKPPITLKTAPLKNVLLNTKGLNFRAWASIFR